MTASIAHVDFAGSFNGKINPLRRVFYFQKMIDSWRHSDKMFTLKQTSEEYIMSMMLVNRFWRACMMLAEDGVIVNGSNYFVEPEVTKLISEFIGIDCFAFISNHSDHVIVLTENGYTFATFGE